MFKIKLRISSTGGLNAARRAVTDGWVGLEIDNYNPATGKCTAICGHYTQVGRHAWQVVARRDRSLLG